MEWIPVATAAERLGLTYRRVLQLVHEHSLAAVRGPDGVLRLPADFLMVEEPQIVRGLPGLLTVLADAGYSDDEAIGWLFTEDPSLEGTPMRAIRAGRSTEVKRRAQALGF
ncbi:MAG: DNA-binding protein [Actinobacteria bacterium]|nr:DNA-binding protein [Actinomycetota bacterium]